ncbi:MAG: TetR/AcrR family transcriptional regulator [Alphaproteobacteria bacterium]|nr:TetR/AcrR family transcriptional regulator [Alphaproteobacteria bacterium]
MRYPPDRKQKTRAEIVSVAGAVFRVKGFDGIGVDGLAAEAGLTSGALYKHFATKRMVFREVVRVGLDRLRAGIERFQHQSPRDWLNQMAHWYLGPAHRADVGGGCALPSLTPEVVKSDLETRAAYQRGLLQALDALMAQPPFRDAPEGRRHAWATLALLAGGVGLARAVPDPVIADEIAAAVRAAVETAAQ